MKTCIDTTPSFHVKNLYFNFRAILERQAAIHEILGGKNSPILGQLRSSLVQTPDLEKGISSVYYKKVIFYSS